MIVFSIIILIVGGILSGVFDAVWPMCIAAVLGGGGILMTLHDNNVVVGAIVALIAGIVASIFFLSGNSLVYYIIFAAIGYGKGSLLYADCEIYDYYQSTIDEKIYAFFNENESNAVTTIGIIIVMAFYMGLAFMAEVESFLCFLPTAYLVLRFFRALRTANEY